MVKLSLIFVLLFNVSTFIFPEDIQGKWVVDNVSSGNMESAPSAVFEAVNEALLKPLKKATFNFKSDHTFELSATLGNMPKGKYWQYNAEKGVIIITEDENLNNIAMVINVTGKNDKLFFRFANTVVIAKVHKLKE